MEKTGMTITHIGGPNGWGVVGKNESRVKIDNGSWLASSMISDLFKPDSSLHTRASQDEYAEESIVLCPLRDVANVRRFVDRVSFEDARVMSGLLLKKRCVWVSPSPFAILVSSTSREAGGMERLAREGQIRTKMDLRIVWPRQIHKGELGRSIPVHPLKIVTGVASAHNPKKVPWVALPELAFVARLNPMDIVVNFLHLRIFSMVDQPSFVYAENEAELVSGNFMPQPSLKGESFGVTVFSIESPVIAAEKSPKDIWVAAAAAKNVLRLIDLGVRNGKEDIFPHRTFM